MHETATTEARPLSPHELHREVTRRERAEAVARRMDEIARRRDERRAALSAATPARAPRPDLPPKPCAGGCGAVLTMREHEYPSHYERRSYCSKTCAGLSRARSGKMPTRPRSAPVRFSHRPVSPPPPPAQGPADRVCLRQRTRDGVEVVALADGSLTAGGATLIRPAPDFRPALLVAANAARFDAAELPDVAARAPGLIARAKAENRLWGDVVATVFPRPNP